MCVWLCVQWLIEGRIVLLHWESPSGKSKLIWRKFRGISAQSLFGDPLFFTRLTGEICFEWRPCLGERRDKYAAWYTKYPCNCCYRFSKHRDNAFPSRRPGPLLLKFMDFFEKQIEFKDVLDCVYITCYMNHEACLGWHQDDEKIFYSRGKNKSSQAINIYSVSLFNPRLFEVRCVTQKNDIKRIPLEKMDIVEMNGFFQNEYLHRIPPCKRVCGPRINFTFRTIRRHSSSECHHLSR